MTDVRTGETLAPCCARLHAQHEAEQTALRLRIAVLEAALEQKTDALHGLLAIHEPLEQQ